MTIATHCPSVEAGTLLSTSIPPCGVFDEMVTIQDPGTGQRRGIVVFLHPSEASDPHLPLAVPNTIGLNFQDLFTPLVADGWLVAYPASPQDFSVKGIEYFGNVYNDVKNDPDLGNGLRRAMLAWWDHLIEYLAAKYGADRPIIVGGFSWGAWSTLNIVLGRTSTVQAYFIHALPTLWENITVFNPPYNQALVDWTNFDYPIDCLVAGNVTIPGIIGWANTDATVGYSLTPLHGPPLSNTIAIIAAALDAGLPLTSYQSPENGVPYPDGHLFLPEDATEYFDFISALDPLYPISF